MLTVQTTNKHLRDQLRLVHILASVVLGIFIYSPWQSNRTLALLMSVGIFPILTLTGLWMWQASQHQQVAQAGS
jgi:hypothetical protein